MLKQQRNAQRQEQKCPGLSVAVRDMHIREALRQESGEVMQKAAKRALSLVGRISMSDARICAHAAGTLAALETLALISADLEQIIDGELARLGSGGTILRRCYVDSADLRTGPLMPLTTTGVAELAVEPFPSWPSALMPQHHTVVSVMTAQAW